jgi:long-chain acyl-CoA synthetase
MHFVAGSIVEYLGLHAGDRILCVLPLSHTYGLYQLIMSVRLGATVVLQHGITLPGTVIAALTEERITVLPGVPTVWQVLVSLDGLAARPLPDLRILTNAGAALSVARVEDVRRTFPGAELFSMYGQTECKRVCYLPPDQLDARPGSVGIAIPGTQAWVDAPPGEVGELLVRGEHVMQGYWRDPEASARRLRPDGVLRSGDLFRADDEGFLYFVARMDDIIKTRGEKVAPKEVEEVIYTFDGVHEAAVIGVEDERLGQAVVAHVSAADGAVLDPRALRRHCARNLEDFMVPRDVVIHEALPKMDNGKLDKLALASLPLAS